MEKNVKVHCLTNPVTMQSVANVLLAAGGSAVMAQDEQEVEEITAMCDGLVLNMGMPNRQKIEAMKKGRKRANALQYSGCLRSGWSGASAFRREAVSELLKEVRFTVIRGNLSEIRTLMCGVCGTRGVDAEPADLMGEKNLYQNVKNGNCNLQQKKWCGCGGNGKERHCIGWKKSILDSKRTFNDANSHRSRMPALSADCGVCGCESEAYTGGGDSGGQCNWSLWRAGV